MDCSVCPRFSLGCGLDTHASPGQKERSRAAAARLALRPCASASACASPCSRARAHARAHAARVRYREATLHASVSNREPKAPGSNRERFNHRRWRFLQRQSGAAPHVT